MSYGTQERFTSKAKFAEHVKATGADKVFVVDTSAFDNQGTVSVASLAGTSAVIVGPNVYTDRKWYANVIRTKSGEVRIK